MRRLASSHPSWLWFQKIPSAHVYCSQSREAKDINMSREHERRRRRRSRRRRRRRRRRRVVRPADEMILALWDAAAAAIKEKWSRVYWGFWLWEIQANTMSNTRGNTQQLHPCLQLKTAHADNQTVFALHDRPPLGNAQRRRTDLESTTLMKYSITSKSPDWKMTHK